MNIIFQLKKSWKIQLILNFKWKNMDLIILAYMIK